MKPDKEGVSRMGIWAGTVRYPPRYADDKPLTGWLVVAKLAVPRTAPFDVVDLARTLPSFPNHPTADQLYTDQKFEAYRSLGHHLGQEAVNVGRSIRKLMHDEMPVKDAVKTVNDELCARPDPQPCPPPTEPEAEKGGKTVAGG